MKTTAQPDDVEETRERRLSTLRGIWATLVQENLFYKDRLALNEAALGEVVQFYLSDLAILKQRYNIQGRIKRHKIAGLMTAAILRFRPIYLTAESYQKNAEVYANEFFAIVHALSICGERNEQTMRLIFSRKTGSQRGSTPSCTYCTTATTRRSP